MRKCCRVGYEVISKPVKFVKVQVEHSRFWEILQKNVSAEVLQKISKEPILQRKCDFDVEISKEILLNLDHFETFILFSGDGDYAAVIQEILNRRKRVFVVSPRRSTGREIFELKKQKISPLLIKLEAIKNYVIKKPTSEPKPPRSNYR